MSDINDSTNIALDNNIVSPDPIPPNNAENVQQNCNAGVSQESEPILKNGEVSSNENPIGDGSTCENPEVKVINDNKSDDNNALNDETMLVYTSHCDPTDLVRTEAEVISSDAPIAQIKEIENENIPIESNESAENTAVKLLENVNCIASSAEESKLITQDEWARRESALLEKISALEKTQEDTSHKGLQLQLQVKCEENDILRSKVKNLETELSAVLKKPNAKNKDIVSKIKKQHDELLTKARGMIFDKTKMIKNQELQIEALTSQVSSLKDVVNITKDLLGIRNLEVTHLQERLEVMDMKIQAEKERQALMSKKISMGTQLNEELKKEYQTQLLLFKELKIRYEEKFKKMEDAANQPSSSEQ